MALKKNLRDREFSKFVEGYDGEDAVRVSSSDFLLEVSEGNIPRYTLVKKFGAHTGLSTAYEPVTETGLYQTPNTLTSLQVVSSSVNDAPAGSGALTITVTGLGPGWVEISEDVVLNGITPVALVNQFYRVCKLRVKDSGVYASQNASSHNSTLSLTGVVGGESWATINSEGGFGLGSSEIAVYSVPKGYTGYLIDVHADIETNKIVDILGFKREGADVIIAPFSPMSIFYIKRSVSGDYFITGSPLVTVVGPADIGFMARQSSGVAKVEVEFTILLKKDN